MNMSGVQFFPAWHLLIFIAIHVILPVTPASGKIDQSLEKQHIAQPISKILKDVKPINVTKMAKQDEGDDEDDGGDDEDAGGLTIAGNNALGALVGLFTPLVSAFGQTSQGVNRFLNGTNAPQIQNFVARQTADTIKLFQGIPPGHSSNRNDLQQQIPGALPSGGAETPIPSLPLVPLLNQNLATQSTYYTDLNLKPVPNNALGAHLSTQFIHNPGDSGMLQQGPSSFGNPVHPDVALSNQLAQSISQYLNKIRMQTASSEMPQSEIYKNFQTVRMHVPFKETTLAPLMQEEAEDVNLFKGKNQQPVLTLLGNLPLLPSQLIRGQSQAKMEQLVDGQPQPEIGKEVMNQRWKGEAPLANTERPSTFKPIPSYSQGRPGYWMNMHYPNGIPHHVNGRVEDKQLTTAKSTRTSTTTASPEAYYYDDDT